MYIYKCMHIYIYILSIHSSWFMFSIKNTQTSSGLASCQEILVSGSLGQGPQHEGGDEGGENPLDNVKRHVCQGVAPFVYFYDS